MPKYRKLPVIIDGIEEFKPGTEHPGVKQDDHGNYFLETIHAGQTVILEEGDFIMPESNGINYYPCKPDIFAKTYELVE